MRKYKDGKPAGAPKIVWCALATILMASQSVTTRADQWLLSGAISERALFDSNIRLSNTDKQSVFGSITSLNGDLAWSTPRASVNLSGFVGISRYTNDSSLNNESFGLNLQSLYRFPRGSVGLGASFQRASTLTTERTDAGNFGEVANQMSVAIFPSWQYELSQLETVSVTGSYARQISDRSAFADSSSYNLNVTWRRQVSLTESVSIAARAGFIETSGGAIVTAGALVSDSLAARNTQSYALLFGWSKSFNPRLVFSVSAGPRLSVTKNSNNLDGDGQGVSVGADVYLQLSYSLSERTTLAVAAGQSLEPSSTGFIEERQRASISLQHQLTPRIGLFLGGRFQHNGGVFSGSNNAPDSGRLLLSTSANLSYRLSPTLSASAQYDFRTQNKSATQRLEQTEGFAFSHAAAIVLTYSPRAWILGN